MGVFGVLVVGAMLVYLDYQKAIRCTVNYPTSTGKPLIEHIRMRPKLDKETGINYFVFRLRKDQMKEYAESIVQPLTGNRLELKT